MNYPPSQTVEQSLASACPTTQHAAIIMAQRDAVGVAKYGQSVDGNPLSASEWAQHAVEEAADGLKYAIRAKEEALKLEREVQELRDKVTRLEAAGDEMAAWLCEPRNLGAAPFMADDWYAAKG